MKPRLDTARRIRPSDDTIATLCASVLTFLAADDERFTRFLSLTGMSPADLRAAAGRAGFAESLLDYLGADERLLRAFASEAGYDPADIDAIRRSIAAPPFDL